MKTISQVDMSRKRVFCRVDFNVPLDDARQITDDARIQAALPTLRMVIAQQGKLIVASHLGRPKGQVVAKYSLSPVARRLEELLDAPVQMAPDCIGPAVEALVLKMSPGSVLMLENLRFHAAEQENNVDFAKRLAGLCDVYVNDAFAVCHRENASVVAIVPHVPVAACGMLLERELEYFKRAMADPKRPLVAVVGGAKVSSKLGALANMISHVDKVLIGGAMANTFLMAHGFEVGASKVETDLTQSALDLMKTASERGVKFYLPVDAVVADRLDAAAVVKTVPIQEIPHDRMILDIGPATAMVYAQALDNAETIVWNGPMGVFEIDAFSSGTLAMANAIAGSNALTIVGGGDTDAALHQAGKTGQVSYISTGGGAFLKLLEGKILPAVAALSGAAG
ncbi:MAG: phosphoglycerate kinase [Deltaproteobacteria bacterium]|nr:phosphoglycerate kinase [Deltaproteobacteria bacterium]